MAFIQSLRHLASFSPNWYHGIGDTPQIYLTQDLPLLLIRVSKRHLILSISKSLHYTSGIEKISPWLASRGTDISTIVVVLDQ